MVRFSALMYVTRCIFCEDDRESAQIKNFANSSSFELFKNQAFMLIFIAEAFHSLSLNQHLTIKNRHSNFTTCNIVGHHEDP